MTADSAHSLTGRKDLDSCYSDLVCQSMSNSPRDTALLQAHTKNTVKPLIGQMKLLFTNSHFNKSRSFTEFGHHYHHVSSNKKDLVFVET